MTLAEVKLWGRTIGAVSLEDIGRFAAFQYVDFRTFLSLAPEFRSTPTH